ncbi:uncharacterized protein LOC129582920 [Paramacrobiotus metropolitanus]|uniref:uncharacterized protein LOC129582920 n=1 Tax=Paramacrobiotus metropolitanus TaxID=2943436 RepID=UPI002446091C|nr:uncharacterized protein LOC129582920 [Paramacrobiotus metropolitanus]
MTFARKDSKGSEGTYQVALGATQSEESSSGDRKRTPASAAGGEPMNQTKVTGEDETTEKTAEAVGASQLDATISGINEQDKNANPAQMEVEKTKVTEEELAELGLDDPSLNDKTADDDLWATPMVSDESNESYFTDDETTMNMSFQSAMRQADCAEGMKPFKEIPEHLIERIQTGKVINVRPPSPTSPTVTLRRRVQDLEGELGAKEDQMTKRKQEYQERLVSLETRLFEMEQQRGYLESAAEEWKVKYEKQREMAEEYLKMVTEAEAKRDEYANKLAEATQRLLTNTTEVFKLRTDLKLRDENIGTLQKESQEHQRRADDAVKVAKDLRDLTATEGARLSNEIKQVKEENQMLKEDNRKVTAENIELKEAAKIIAEQGMRWEHEAHLLDTKVTALELKDKEWQQIVHQKTQEIIKLNAELIDMTQTEKTFQLHQHMMKVKEENQNLKTEKEEFQLKVRRLEDENKALNMSNKHKDEQLLQYGVRTATVESPPPSYSAVEENAWIRIKVGTNDDHLAYTYSVDGKLLTKERIRPKPTADPDPNKRTLDDYESTLKYTDGTCRKVTLTLHFGDGTTDCLTAVIVDPITGDPIPYAPWDMSEESAEHANRTALEQLGNLIPVSERQDPLVQANTLISMMRHGAEIDEAHFRLTRKMENGAYKTVFYDAKNNPLWEIVTQAPAKETPHLEIQAQDPAQESGAGEMAEASVAEAASTESTRRPSKQDDSEEEEAGDDSAEEPADEDKELDEEDNQPPKVVIKPRKTAKLDEAMNREKAKKGDFLKKRKEEEDKKRKSGDESESSSIGKKKEERRKKDKPPSHDVEILEESVAEVEERSSTPIIPKKFVIESATSKLKVTEPEPSTSKGKVIAVKQIVPIVISASTTKERREKGTREKAKRETSRESEASEVSLPSTSTVSTRSHTDPKTTRSRTTEPRSLAEALERGKKAKSEPTKPKKKGKEARKIDALAMANYTEPDGESELDYSGDEAEFEDPDSDNMTTIDEIIDAFNGAEKNFTRIRTTSVTSKFRTGLKKYLRKEMHRSFTKQKFDVVLEYARNAGKLLQKHPNFAYKAKLFRPSSSDKALTTPNEDTSMRVERAIAEMTSPMGSTSHRISQYINAVWNDGKGLIKEIDTATERALPRMIKQNILSTTNAHKGYPIRYTRVGLIPPEKQGHCNMSDSQETEKVPLSGDPTTPILNRIAQLTAEEEAAQASSKKATKKKGPMDVESEESDDHTSAVLTPLEPVTEKSKGQETPVTATEETQPKGHGTSEKGEKEKVMLPMDKAATEAEAASARQVYQKSLFAPLKEAFEKERSKSAGEVGGHETLPQKEKTDEPKSAQSSSSSLAKLRIDETETTDPTDSALSPQKTETSGIKTKEPTNYTLGAPLDVTNRTWSEVQAALQYIREGQMLGPDLKRRVAENSNGRSSLSMTERVLKRAYKEGKLGCKYDKDNKIIYYLPKQGQDRTPRLKMELDVWKIAITDVALDAIGGTNGASWNDLSNFMAVHYELGELNIENDKEWIKNAVEALIADEVLHINQDG